MTLLRLGVIFLFLQWLSIPVAARESPPTPSPQAAPRSAERKRYEDLCSKALLDADLKRTEEFLRSVKILERDFPDSPGTLFLLGIREAHEGHWLAAEARMYESIQRGMPADAVEKLLDDSGIRTLARVYRWTWRLAGAILVLATGLLLLFVVGKALSALTLRSIALADPGVPLSSGQRSLRLMYRGLIQFAGLYYYLCLPFVNILAVLIFLVLGYIGLAIAFVFLKFIFVILLFGGATFTMIGSSIRSIFKRIEAPEHGQILKEEEAPALWMITRQVADAVGTRPVDEIRLTDGAEVAVSESGSWWQKRSGRAKRILLLGWGALEEFPVEQFRAVISHEFGHFLHGDTAGGDIALRVNVTMIEFAQAMAERGSAQWWNIGWQYVRLYHFIFRRITHGASRLQELNADRVAALTCGKSAFEAGLRHVIYRNVVQSAEIYREIHNDLLIRATAGNVEPWSLLFDRAEARYQIWIQFQKIWNEGATEDDTHPCPTERVRALARLPDRSPTEAPTPKNAVAVTGLFTDPVRWRTERDQRRMHNVNEMVSNACKSMKATIGELDSYISDNPMLTRPLIERAELRLTLGHTDKVEADLTEAIRRDDSDTSRAHIVRARVRTLLEDFDGAIADLERAMALEKPADSQVQLELGDVLWQADHLPEAIQCYSRVLDTEPDHLGVILRRGEARSITGDQAGALTDYDHVLSLDPRCAEALAGRALVLSLRGERSRAEADARAAVAIEPSLREEDEELANLLQDPA